MGFSAWNLEFYTSMAYPLKLYLRNIPNAVMIGVCLLANAAMWIWIAWQIPKQAEPIFLHYNIIFGVDRVGTFQELLLIPSLGLGILVVNYILGWLAFKYDSFMPVLLNFSALLANVFLFINGLLLVFLNI